MTENLFPYELPENWHWTTLGEIAKIFTGNSINEKIKQEKYFGRTNGIIYIATKDVGVDKKINYDTKIKIPESENFKIAPKNTTLLCIEGGSAGKKIGFTNQPVCFVNKLCAFVGNEINSKLIYFFMQTDFFLNQFNAKKHGLIGGVSVKDLSEIIFPLPPIDEQKKIVKRIESLFSKLDSAKSIVQKILDGYELRRSAILHKAFTGELSKNFRAENNLSLDDWENLPLPCIFSIKSGATLPIEEEKSTGKIPYVKVSDMNIKENSVQIITSSKFVDNCRQANIIPEGSVIFPKRGGAIFTNKKRYVGVEKIVADLNIMALIPNCNKIFSWYGYYWMLSVDLKEICNGSNIPQINHKDMMKLFLSLPPLAEQKEIVRVLDSLLDKEQRTQEIAEKILQEIDLLKKSVLARAFRGEL